MGSELNNICMYVCNIPLASVSEIQDDTSGMNVSKSNFPVFVPDFKYQYLFSSSMMSNSCTTGETINLFHTCVHTNKHALTFE